MLWMNVFWKWIEPNRTKREDGLCRQSFNLIGANDIVECYKHIETRTVKAAPHKPFRPNPNTWWTSNDRVCTLLMRRNSCVTFFLFFRFVFETMTIDRLMVLFLDLFFFFLQIVQFNSIWTIYFFRLFLRSLENVNQSKNCKLNNGLNQWSVNAFQTFHTNMHCAMASFCANWWTVWHQASFKKLTQQAETTKWWTTLIS